MALAHVHHIKYATFVFHRNPCFKSGCEPQQRALAAPKHPKPSCLFKCARVNQFLNQCAPALLISFPHTHHFSIFSIINIILISFSKLCSYHFHTPTISQYFPFSISSSYHSHIILIIMLISFPQPTISQYYPHHPHALKFSMSHIFRV